MSLQLVLPINPKLALRDPERTELGKKIVRQGLLLMESLGYEHFTFRKLAEAIGTTEAGIYRYFENKHKLLLYLLTWHWGLVDYSVATTLHPTLDIRQKISAALKIVLKPVGPTGGDALMDLDTVALFHLARAEGRKVYLVKEVDEINREKLFKPYKDLCNRLASLFREYNPQYPYHRSLASTVLEMAQLQPYFALHLPALTDVQTTGTAAEYGAEFLETLIFSALCPAPPGTMP